VVFEMAAGAHNADQLHRVAPTRTGDRSNTESNAKVAEYPGNVNECGEANALGQVV
jgi:hypothetical protein